MIRKRYFAILAITVIFVSASPVMAGYQDIFVSLGTSAPSDPSVDEYDNVTWPGWEWITLPYTTYIPAGYSLFVGLENIYVEDWTKTVTLEYWAPFDIVPTNARAGYPSGATMQWDTTWWPGLGLVTGDIDPQSSWEWIELKNIGAELNEITITEYYSECIPEPATLSILALGGIVLRRWRKT